MGSGKGQNKRVSKNIIISSGKYNNIYHVRNFKDYKNYFSKYPKILAIHKIPEIINFDLEITEKIHGANCRLILLDEGYALGSRRLELDPNDDGQFKSIMNYVKESKWLASLRENLPTGTILYGEAYGQGFQKGMGYSGDAPSLRLFNYKTFSRSEHTSDQSSTYHSSHDLDIPDENKVPLLGPIKKYTMEELKDLLPGSKIAGEKEGIVLKAYGRTDDYGHPLWGKYVRKEFIEDKNKRREIDPETLRIREAAKILVNDLVTPARCQKVLDRASEANELSGDMTDMPILIKSLRDDLTEEHTDDINKLLVNEDEVNILYKLSSPKLANWYKEHLISLAFKKK